jgi:hypothetical protein
MAITINAMENLSRAYNRHKQETKFKKRVKNWFKNTSERNRDYYKQLAIEGTYAKFLKTTGKPCSCILCSGNKYKRKPKCEVIKRYLD